MEKGVVGGDGGVCVCVYAKDGTQNVWLKVLRIKIC